MSVHIGVCVCERIRQGTLTHSVVRQRGQRGLIDYNLVRFFFFFLNTSKKVAEDRKYTFTSTDLTDVCAHFATCT